MVCACAAVSEPTADAILAARRGRAASSSSAMSDPSCGTRAALRSPRSASRIRSTAGRAGSSSRSQHRSAALRCSRSGAALLAVPALGGAGGGRALLAHRHPDPSGVRPVARLSRRYPSARGDQPAAPGTSASVRRLRGSAMPDALPRERLFVGWLRCRRLRRAHCCMQNEIGACMDVGCLARLACPIGTAWRYQPEHARFHMHAFLKARIDRKERPVNTLAR